MSANGVAFVSNLTFVSTAGPTLDHASAKAMRAHITRANFARRRRRLVREYAEQREHTVCLKPRQVKGDGQARQVTDRGQVVNIQSPILSLPGLDQRLNRVDAFFIIHLAQAMEKLHLVANLPPSDTASAVMGSDWARFLADPTMLDVSLYFGRHVYAARLQRHPFRSALDKYNGRAIRSVRERLNHGYHDLSDGLVAAILILTVVDQVLGNIEGWKIHISGLLQIMTVRSRNSHNAPAPWISRIIRHTTLQGLLFFIRHDMTLLTTVEKTGVFDMMFSGPGTKVVYLIFAIAEEAVALQDRYIQNERLLASDQMRLVSMIESVETAIQLNNTGHTEEVFLTVTALAIKIFLETVLQSTTNTKESNLENTAVRLMTVLQQPDQELCSSLALCSYLESRFWQTMMGAIAAPDARTASFYKSRLRRITTALALASWHDALLNLQRFFWIPTIFSGPCQRILSEILD